VTVGLIMLNVAVFLHEQTLGRHGLELFVREWGLVPADFAWDRVVTSMFLHGGWAHAGGNMLYLWIFGDNVEDTLGHLRFLTLYVLSGVGAATAQILMSPGSDVPMVGASGAISGVLGAYLILFPHASVLTLITFGFFIRFVHVPAVIVLGFWIVVQVLNGLLSYGALAAGAAEGGGVAWFAHIGGFVAGVILLFLLRPRVTRRL
jgi:membrane associated rhomboid family serine protease